MSSEPLKSSYLSVEVLSAEVEAAAVEVLSAKVAEETVEAILGGMVAAAVEVVAGEEEESKVLGVRATGGAIAKSSKVELDH